MVYFSLAVVPVFLALAYVYFRDLYEKEPLYLLVVAFLLGCLSVVPVMMCHETLLQFQIFFTTPIIKAVYDAFCMAAIPEELVKFLFLFALIWRNRNFNEHFDGIVYAVFISMGFACVENLLYVFGAQLNNGTGMIVGVCRALFSIPGHFLFAVIMGYYFALARFTPDRRSTYLFLSIFCAILAHGIFNTILFWTGGTDVIFIQIALVGGFILFDIILWLIAIRRLRHLSKLSYENPAITLEEPWPE